MNRPLPLLAALVLAGCGGGGGGDLADAAGDVGARDGAAAVNDGGDVMTGADPGGSDEGRTDKSLKLRVDGRRLLDADGREIVLRGLNAGGRAKTPPFFAFPFAESGRDEQAGAPPFDEAAGAYVAAMASWGLNAVRLPFTWEAMEPTRGTYDDVFLGRYSTLIDAFEARGIRVVVDFHQDVFARPYCGDGFPLWALPDPPGEIENECEDWFVGYIQTGHPSQAAYDRFWANEDGLMDAFEAMWRHVAGALWSKDAVIGFEVINEPGWGTADRNLFSADVLTPFYERMTDVVREVAPDALVFFDSTGIDAVSGSTSLRRPDREGLIFAPHYYAPGMLIGGPEPTERNVVDGLGAWGALGESWDLPVLVGEFGARPDDPLAVDYLRWNWNELDRHLMHGTQWEYSTTVDDWNEEGLSVAGPGGTESVLVDVLRRPYPRAIAGRISSFELGEGDGCALTFDATAGGRSEVAAPASRYPGGPIVELEGAGSDGATSEWDEDAEVVVVLAPNAGALVVRMSPR